MNALRLSVVSLTLGSALLLRADLGQPSHSLTLEDCIDQSIAHNLNLRIARIGPIVAQNNLSLARAGYDPTFNFNAQHDFDRTGGGLDSDQRIIPPSESDSDSFSGGLGGLLPWGMTYDVSAAARNTTGDRGFFDTNGVFFSTPFENTQGRVQGTITQPILRNAWMDSTRLNIAISKNELARSKEQYRLQIIDLVTAVEQAYYDLIAARENVKVQETGLQLARKLLEENRKRVEVGALAPLDESQAESEVAAREADLVFAQQDLGTRENVLRRLITDDYATWQKMSLVPADPLSAIPQALDIQDSWDKGLTMRPEIVLAWLLTEQYNVQLKYTRNQLYPQLDGFATYGFSGSDVEFSDLFSQWNTGDQPFWSAGARFSVPISNSRARADHRNSKAAIEESVLRLKDTEQLVMAEIDNAIKVARSSFRRVGATREARQYAEAALEAEEEKLANGKSTSFEVLRLQRDLTQARSAEIGALTEYNKALTVVAQSEGTTLRRHRIEFEEY